MSMLYSAPTHDLPTIDPASSRQSWTWTWQGTAHLLSGPLILARRYRALGDAVELDSFLYGQKDTTAAGVLASAPSKCLRSARG